ncbi:hypothetical protein LSTR_LSTR014650, partial [Laodelphax striatellus]
MHSANRIRHQQLPCAEQGYKLPLSNADFLTFGVNVNLDFLNNPDFPGNAGWNAKLDQQIKDTICTEVPDPKIKFKEDNYDSFMIYTANGVQQIPKIEKKYFLCTDKKYGNDDYYIVKTIKSYGPNSFSSWENVFDKKGEKMGYSSHT